jgi:hypothetical protein
VEEALEMSDVEKCIRCDRPAPNSSDPAYATWRPIVEPNGEVGIACPNCLTAGELRAKRDLSSSEREQRQGGDA